jgi:virulence-associated protein VagC
MRKYRTWGKSRAVRLPSAFYPPNEAVHVILTTTGGRAVFED